MGLLARSNVMLLTILWGTCLIVGKCDLQNSTAVDQKDTKRFSLTGSGVSTDKWTSYAAVTMNLIVMASYALLDKELQEARARDMTLRGEQQESLELSQHLMPMLN